MRLHLESFGNFRRLSRTLSVVSVLSRKKKVTVPALSPTLFERKTLACNCQCECVGEREKQREGFLRRDILTLESNSSLKICKSECVRSDINGSGTAEPNINHEKPNVKGGGKECPSHIKTAVL
jgi:hypothetical protein